MHRQAREEPGLAVPSLAWLGVLPSDLPALQLPAHALLPLTPTDHGKLATLAAHPLVSKCPAWLQQVSSCRTWMLDTRDAWEGVTANRKSELYLGLMTTMTFISRCVSYTPFLDRFTISKSLATKQRSRA